MFTRGLINLYEVLPIEVLTWALDRQDIWYVLDLKGYQVVPTMQGKLTLEPVHIGVLKQTPTNLLLATVTDTGGVTGYVPAEHLLVEPIP